MGLTNLPAELINNITSHLDLGDYLALKLTCKHVAALAPNNIAAVAKAKAEKGIKEKPHDPFTKLEYHFTGSRVLSAHGNLERAIHRSEPKRILQHLVCTSCIKVKPRAQFADSNRHRLKFSAEARTRRWCLKCRIRANRHYSDFVHRVLHARCAVCLRFVPKNLTDTTRTDERSARAVITQGFLAILSSEGVKPVYRNADL